jgi:endonuclease/exonuclease/phosphatase family metal-dependent hydrolase
MDGKLDLDRTADVLKDLSPDFVCLQEVDLFEQLFDYNTPDSQTILYR